MIDEYRMCQKWELLPNRGFKYAAIISGAVDSARATSFPVNGPCQNYDDSAFLLYEKQFSKSILATFECAENQIIMDFTSEGVQNEDVHFLSMQRHHHSLYPV